MADEGTDRWVAPPAPPSTWPTPSASEPDPSRRRRWPWIAGAGAVLVASAATVGVIALTGDDGDESYCTALEATVRQDVPMLVFLVPSTGVHGIERIERELRATEGVSSLVYVDQEQAYAEAQELFADEPEMQDLLTEDDVPTSFRFIVPDRRTGGSIRRDLAGDVWVLRIEEAWFLGDSVREVVAAIDAEEVEGDLGKFGHWVAPDVADAVRDAAPDEVAEHVEVLLPVLADDAGELGPEQVDAARAIVADTETRCPTL